MNRGKKLIALMAGCFLLAGCGAGIPDMTEEQTETVTRYAAQLLLKYDKNYDSGMMSEAELEEQVRMRITPTPLPVVEIPEENEGNGTAEDHSSEELIGKADAQEPVDNRTLAEFFGLEGVDITYRGFQVTASYPESETDDPYFAMDALEGNQLLILQFEVSNRTGEAVSVDLLSLTPRFRIYINDGGQINAQSTLLMDDLKTMQETIQPGETVYEVVVVEITQEEAEIVTGDPELQLALMVRTDEDSLRMQLSAAEGTK